MWAGCWTRTCGCWHGVSSVPRLILAGSAGPDAANWLDAIARPPLAGHVEYVGYVPAERREALFKGAQLFVLPSFEEGFGLPVLEAMAAGVPVVASNRGSLPEVIGDAGLLIDPDNPENLADAITRIIGDATLRTTCSHRGLDRARQFTWSQTARDVRRAYEDALMGRRRSRVQSLESRVQSLESRVQSPESRIQSPESGVQSFESRVRSRSESNIPSGPEPEVHSGNAHRD